MVLHARKLQRARRMCPEWFYWDGSNVPQ